jgi:hypothetical protein
LQALPESRNQEELGLWTRIGHEFILPFGSVFIPGLGQWVNGATLEGFGFLGASVAGAVISVSNEDGHPSADELPRDREEQFSQLGLQLSLDAGLLSGYDSFLRSLPKLKTPGRYDFFDDPTPTAHTFVAPFKFGYLKNKRTWIFLTIPIAIVAGLAIEERGTEHPPFRWHDAVYASGSAYGAGVTEEAFFRGYLYPWLNELFGGRAWLANSSQALVFGAGHLATTDLPIVQTLAGLYWGWVVKKDRWSISETIFQHFWWDAILFTGTLLLDDEGDATFLISLPPMRF